MIKRYSLLFAFLVFMIFLSSIFSIVKYASSSDDEIVNISQENCDVCNVFFDYAYQEFIPTVDVITKIEVKIADFYFGSPNVTLSLQKPFGNVITNLSLPYSQISYDDCDWVVFDINDTTVDKHESYYLVLSYPGGGEYAWCGSSGDPYADGVSSEGADWDWSFRIIGYNFKEPPDLVINNIYYEGNFIWYQIENIGESDTVLNHYNALFINDEYSVVDYIDVNIEPNQNLTRSFNYTWYCNQTNDSVKVIADYTNLITEINEDNNIRNESWNCTVCSDLLNVKIVDIQTDKSLYEIGEKVSFNITVSCNFNQDINVNTIIVNKTTNEVINILPVEKINGMTGPFVISQQWLNGSVETGYYDIEVSLTNYNGYLLDRKTQSFNYEIIKGEIKQFKVTSEDFVIGDKIKIEIDFINNGTEEINGVCFIDITNSSGSIIKSFQMNISDLNPYEIINLNKTWNTDDISSDNYNISCYVTYNGKSTLVKTINVVARVKNEESDELPVSVIIISATAAAIVGGLAAVVLSEEIKYKLFLLLGAGVPLFTRINKEEALESPVREEINGYIKENPGAHYNKIKKNLEIGNGTLAHHLRILEKTGFITSRTEGFRYRLFYPIGLELPKVKKYILNDQQKEILEIITQNRGITQKEIVNLLGESQQKISYNLKELERVNRIVKIKEKGMNHYYVSEQGSDKYSN